MRTFRGDSKLLKAAPVIRRDAAWYEADRLLEAVGVSREQRHDAGETAVFARQLQAVKSATYDVRYPNLKARTFIPVDSSIPTGAESFVWRGWDWAGLAKIISNYADDLPMVAMLGAEVVQLIKSIGTEYTYTIQDVRAAAMAGVPLDAKRAQAVRRAVENLIEQIAAIGNAAALLPGMLNNANVPILVGGTDITGNWDTATASQILDDLNIIGNSVTNKTKTVHSANTIIFDLVSYNIVNSKIMNNLTNETVLQVFLKNQAYVRNADQWIYLALANAAGNGPRVVAYDRSPEVLELVIPQEFEQLPPQARKLGFEVPCHARIGGVSIRYPLAMVYADGVHS